MQPASTRESPCHNFRNRGKRIAMPQSTPQSRSRRRRIDNMEGWSLGSQNESNSQLNYETTHSATPSQSHIHTIYSPYETNDSMHFHYDRLDYHLCEAEGYLDVGDAMCKCNYCFAQFWYDECVDRNVNTSNPQFSMYCLKGKITIPYLMRCPELLRNLINGVDRRSKAFINNSSMFAFTSIGAKVETAISRDRGPPQFVISGQNYHRIGTLVPMEGQVPKFAQLYVYDTENEVKNRLSVLRLNCPLDGLDSSLVRDIIKIIDDHNMLAKSFRRVRDYVAGVPVTNFCVRLFRHKQQDPRTYNLPTVDEVATLIFGEFDSANCGRDIIIRGHGGDFQRIHETHTCYLPLQYPLLFPYGEDGYYENMKFHGSDEDLEIWKRKRVSLREYIAFRVQERQNEKSILL